MQALKAIETSYSNVYSALGEFDLYKARPSNEQTELNKCFFLKPPRLHNCQDTTNQVYH